MTDYLNGGRWSLIQEVVEVESGKRSDRPKLAEALRLCRLCRLHGAKLVIAKLDRLSRDATFSLNLQAAGVRSIAADMLEANELMVGIMAVVAQAERQMISTRTKAALAAAKAQGTNLGGDRGVIPSAEAQASGGTAMKAKADSRAFELVGIIGETD